MKPERKRTRKKNKSCGGFILIRNDDTTLGHDLKWYKHKSIDQEGYVHDIDTVLEHGREGDFILAARYHGGKEDFTEAVGSREPFAKFDKLADQAIAWIESLHKFTGYDHAGHEQGGHG